MINELEARNEMRHDAGMRPLDEPVTTSTPLGAPATLREAFRRMDLPAVNLPPYCSRCGKPAIVATMKRTVWTAKTGWIEKPWSRCCDAQVLR